MLETIEEAVTREIFEETCIVIKIENPALYINSSIQNTGRYKGYTYVNLVNEARVTAGTLKLTDKHSDYKWATKAEILGMKLAPYMERQISELFLTGSEN